MFQCIIKRCVLPSRGKQKPACQSLFNQKGNEPNKIIMHFLSRRKESCQ